MGKQVEALENEADVTTQAVELRSTHLGVDILAVEHELTGLNPLEPIDGPDQGRLARTGRTAHNHNLAAFHLGVDIGERLIAAIPFVDVAEFDH